jgi:site-specific DNA-adenine methylase
MTLKAPFPYFGGKRAVAAAVWQRFGNVQTYVEPFCGSATKPAQLAMDVYRSKLRSQLSTLCEER